jgi:hypothetical protein
MEATGVTGAKFADRRCPSVCISLLPSSEASAKPGMKHALPSLPLPKHFTFTGSNSKMRQKVVHISNNII